MKTYNPSEPCPKCGALLSSRKWMAFYNVGEPIGDEKGILIARCVECGYECRRAPLDAPK